MKKNRRKSKRGKFIFRICMLTIASLMFGINIYHWNATTMAGNQMPMPFGIGASVVLSGSMEPALSVNDLIIVKEKNEYFVNDVVVFQDGKSLTVHRIISADGEMYQTQGDANNTPDSPITFEKIQGKVILTIPAVGNIVRVLKSPAVTGIVLILAVMLIELSHRREHQKDDADLDEIKAEIRRLRQEQEALK